MRTLSLKPSVVENDKALLSFFRVLRRYRRSWFVIFLSLLVLISAVVFLLPATYRAKSVILIEQQEIPQDLVRSTITSYADQRIQVISQYVMRSENLLGLVQRYQLYPNLVASAPVEDVLREVTQSISTSLISADVVDPVSGKAMSATIAFEITFDYPNPELAQKVANDITSLYLNAHTEQRHAMALETADFFEKESARLSHQLDILQQELADFKKQHGSQLPERLVLNVNLKERLQRDILNIEQQLRTLDSNAIHLRSRLQQLEPHLAVVGDNGQSVSIGGRLSQLRNQELSLLSTYAESHPDVLRVRQEIRLLSNNSDQDLSLERYSEAGDLSQYTLRQLELELQESLSRYSSEHPEVKRLQSQISAYQVNVSQAKQVTEWVPDNPAYVQIQTQLEANLSQRASLGEQRDVLLKQVNNYTMDLAESPTIEREYLTLMRDVTSTADKYRELRAKTMEAQLAASLELDSKGERFSLIEPAMLPEKPINPNRLALFCLGFSTALLISLVVVNVRDSFDGRMHGARAVYALTGVAPLAVIPLINQRPSRTYQHFPYLVGFLVLLLVLLFGLTAVHMFIKPIDVLGFIILRKLGL